MEYNKLLKTKVSLAKDSDGSRSDGSRSYHISRYWFTLAHNADFINYFMLSVILIKLYNTNRLFFEVKANYLDQYF